MRLEEWRASGRLACPRCRSTLQGGPDWRCGNAACEHHTSGFPEIAGKPALIDFPRSIIDPRALVAAEGGSTLSRKPNLLRRLREMAAAPNNEAASNCASFLDLCRTFPSATVLIVGGGSRGSGTAALYAGHDIERVVTDVYASDDVVILADGHALPFPDGTFQGVWIQAVLEHVVVPEQVVAEIARVLVENGIVYAETPFLQAVHERANDFTRFTPNGHRWLFRHFAEIRAGTIGGPAASLLWSIRYLVRAAFRSEKLGSLAAVAFFWLSYIDRLLPESFRSDAATGVFFLGRKASSPIAPRDLLAYFRGVRGK